MAHDKIQTVPALAALIAEARRQKKTVVHCHGVFDLLHPGHIRHFQDARKQGDLLVVTLTADRHVNKGAGRPVFTEAIRAETLAAITHIDFVAINEEPDAINLINTLKPSVYVKGIEYKNFAKDVTNKIQLEVDAVESNGGRMHYTDDIVFSSTELLNTYFGALPEAVKTYAAQLKARYSLDDLQASVESLADLKVLVIGDAILDEYQYVDPLGQSGKGLHMVARCRQSETFAGGVFAVANHVANFAGQVTMLTAIGADDGSCELIEPLLSPKITRQYVPLPDLRTLVKKRYVLKDGEHLSKLFETYSGADNLISDADAARVCNFIREAGNQFDAIIVCDFGNGFVNRGIVKAVTDTTPFLAVNAQINSGNRGYNVVTHYPRADYISLNEPELRLTAHDKHGALKPLIEGVCQMMRCRNLSVTRGVYGVVAYDQQQGYAEIPALTLRVVDRVGAGDSYLAVSALCLAKGVPHDVAAFIGSTAAAIDVQIVGNKESVDKAKLLKYITTLMK